MGVQHINTRYVVDSRSESPLPRDACLSRPAAATVCTLLEGHSRSLMEGGCFLVVRAWNILEELQREAVYVEVAHEDATSGGMCYLIRLCCWKARELPPAC